MLMLGKINWADSEGALSAVAIAVIFTLDHVSLSCFTALFFLTTFVATRRCRCLLQSVRVIVMPWRLLFVISEILAGGIPSFRIELCCFSHPLIGPLCFFVGLVVFIFMGHLLLWSIFFTQKLELVTSLLRGVCCFCLFAFVFVGLCFVVFCAGFGFCFLFLGVLLGFLDERDRA